MSFPFSLNEMFVRKSNNKVHVIFKDKIENIKVSTFAVDGKRQFVPRDQVLSLLVVYCSLPLHKKNIAFSLQFYL